MEVRTQHFGVVSYTPDEVICFPQGLPGLEHLQHFLILHQDQPHPIKYLQSIDNPYFSFILVNPQLIDANFTLQMSEADQADIGLSEGGGVLMYAILTVQYHPEKVFCNLFAPIVINAANLVAKQVFMFDSGYPVRAEVVLDERNVFTAV